MRFLKLIIGSIAILFIIATLLGALLPSHVLVSRAVNIAAPVDTVKPYIQDINQWRSWIEGMQDTSVTVYSAQKAKLGGTEVMITQVTDSTVVSVWTGRNGGQQTATIRLIGSPEQKLTVVQWQFEQKLKWYPWERLGSMMNDKILGTMMEKNLNRLRELLEKPRS
jgi:carbon monoxide dehydrogenase subunit G